MIRSWVLPSRATLASLIICTGLLWLLLSRIHIQALLFRLAQITWSAVAIFLAVYLLAWCLRTLRLKALTDSLHTPPLPILKLFQAHVIGFALNSILPARMGEMAFIGFLCRLGMHPGKAAATLIQVRVLDLTALALLLPLAMRGLGQPGLERLLIQVIGLLFVLGIILVLIALDRKEHLNRMLNWVLRQPIPSFVKWALLKIQEAYSSYRSLLRDRKLWFITWGLSLFIWTLEAVAFSIVWQGLGGTPNLIKSLCAVGVGNLGKILPITPGGFGLYEGLAAWVLSITGVPFQFGLAVALADHVLKKSVNLFLGGLSAVPLLLSAQSPRTESRGTSQNNTRSTPS